MFRQTTAKVVINSLAGMIIITITLYSANFPSVLSSMKETRGLEHKFNIAPDSSIHWIILDGRYALLILPKPEYALQSTFEIPVVLSIYLVAILFSPPSAYCSNVRQERYLLSHGIGRYKRKDFYCWRTIDSKHRFNCCAIHHYAEPEKICSIWKGRSSTKTLKKPKRESAS